MFFDAGGQQLQAEAEDIWLKIRNIKIPKPDPENWLVAYLYLDEAFNDVRLVPRLDPPHTPLKMVLDMGFACQFDWMENLMLAKLIKRILFGGSRPSRQRIERFFEDPQNFHLPAPIPQKDNSTLGFSKSKEVNRHAFADAGDFYRRFKAATADISLNKTGEHQGEPNE